MLDSPVVSPKGGHQLTGFHSLWAVMSAERAETEVVFQRVSGKTAMGLSKAGGGGGDIPKGCAADERGRTGQGSGCSAPSCGAPLTPHGFFPTGQPTPRQRPGFPPAAGERASGLRLAGRARDPACSPPSRSCTFLQFGGLQCEEEGLLCTSLNL